MRIARLLLLTLCFFHTLAAFSSSLAAEAPVPDELFSREFYANATPDELRAKLQGTSLRGVARPWHDYYTSVTPLMLAAKYSPHPEAVDMMVRAGAEVAAFSQEPWQPGDKRNYCWDHELTALHFAAQNSNPEVLRRLLAYKPDLNAVTVCSNQFTALHMASEFRDLWQNFILLLEAGADPRLAPSDQGPVRSEEAPLHLWRNFIGQGGFVSPAQDPVEMASALLATSALPDDTIFYTALRAGQYATAQLMLDAGFKPQSKGALCAAMDIRYRSGDEMYPLPDPSAAFIKQLAALDDVNAACGDVHNSTPLRLACIGNQDVAIARLLVEAGADLDPKGDASLKKRQGYYPASTLILDSLQGRRDNPELVRYLLSVGLGASTLLGQQDLIDVAAVKHKPQSAVELIKAGADPVRLRLDWNYRRLAREAGILDKFDKPLVQGAMTQATQGRLAFERALVLDAKKGLFGDDPGMWSYMHCASPQDIEAEAAKRNIGKRKYEREKPSRPRSSQNASFSSYFRRKGQVTSGGGVGGLGWTYLSSVTALNPHPESVERLAALGADFYEEEGKAIRYAFDNPNPEMAKAVLRHSKKEDIALALTSSLHWAACAHPSHAAALLEAGFDLNAKSRDERVIRNVKRPVSNVVLYAAKYGNYAFVRELIKAGVDLDYADKDSFRVLDILIGDREYELALAALEAGADCAYSPVQYSRNMLEYIKQYPPKKNEQEADYQRLLQQIQSRCGG
ncbi:exported hypothetical protein [uncultured delta proteobacterium]|uniref:Ankyrin n=1 Tax=uncultured delta proteobacterium TaxID=34034 RepID=A0A212IX79_9DELT|nr:exported hypothetical protein [uncultured delta proteobacterium]